MFKDINKYVTHKEFRCGFDESFNKYRGYCEPGDFSLNLSKIRDCLWNQYNELLACDEYSNRMVDFELNQMDFFESAFKIVESNSFDSNRLYFIENIIDLMYVTRSNFGSVELQILYGYVVSSHQVYDVIYSLRLLDFVESLLKNDPNSVCAQKIIQSEPVDVFGETFNKTVFDYVGVRLLGFESAREIASIRSFIQFLETR